MTNIGDVYLTQLERGFWGAFKILKRGKLFENIDDLFLIGVLDIIDIQKPLISDERLSHILCCNRFFFNNRYCIEFFTSNEKYNKIKKYGFLGNLPLTEVETKLKFELGSGDEGLNGGFPSSGVIENHFVNNAFLEWRWKNEKEEFIREIEEQKLKDQAIFRNRVLEPKKMIPDSLFWGIISLFNWKETDDEKIIEPAVKYLSKLKVADIRQFEENLTYKLYCLDTKEHAKNIGEYSYNERDDYISADLFLYVRCAAVVNGKEFYERVLNDPTLMPKDIDFEALLGLSAKAYELKTKKEFDYTTGCDYETFSNMAGWK
jgi:hypothetical protein